MNYDLNEIINILAADTVAVPKSVLFNDEIYFESKILFSEAFTISLAQISENGRTGKTVSQLMKETVKAMEISEIQFYCFCTETMAEAVRGEVIRLINHTDISECLKRRA